MTLVRRRLTWLRVVALLALGIAVAGALAPVVASLAWRRYQVWRAFPVAPGTPDFVWGYASSAGQGHERYDVGGVDPWGNRWRRRDAYEGWSVWSKGPDGRDDGGAGDDEAVDTRVAAVDLAPSWSVAGALGLLYLAAALRALVRPRGPELGAEVGRALFATSAPALGLGLVVAAKGLPDLLQRGPPLLVPRPVAAVGAAWLVLSLAALAWRVRGSARRGRLPLRLFPLVAVPLVAALALTMAWRGQQAVLERRVREGRLAMAFAGDAPSFVQVCKEGEPGQLDALLAAAPTYRATVRLDEAAAQALARFGPAANRYVVSSLLDTGWRWGSAATADSRLGLAHLARHDPELRGLAEGARALPEWLQPIVVADEPLLLLALLGTTPQTVRELYQRINQRWGLQEHEDRALHALLTLRADPDLPRTREEVARLDDATRAALEEQLHPWLVVHGAHDPVDEAEERLIAGRTSAPIPGDRWLVLRVTAPSTLGALRLLVDEAPRHGNRVELADDALALVVVGPLADPVREGAVLTLLEPRGDWRLLVTLPALERGAVWVDADLGSGRASARRLR